MEKKRSLDCGRKGDKEPSSRVRSSARSLSKRSNLARLLYERAQELALARRQRGRSAAALEHKNFKTFTPFFARSLALSSLFSVCPLAADHV